VLSGATLAPTEQGLIADVRPSPAAERLTRAAPLNLSRAERRRWWQRWVAAFEATRGGTPDPGLDLSDLGRALHDPDLRDAVLMHLLGVDPGALPGWVDDGWWEGTSRDDDDRGEPWSGDQRPGDRQPGDQRLGGVDGIPIGPPDEERLRNGEALLAAAVRTAAPGARGPALALLALLAWYLGRNSRARLLVEQAHADGRPLSLADLVEHLLLNYRRPPWMATSPDG
jgi:hypothetical protein